MLEREFTVSEDCLWLHLSVLQLSWNKTKNKSKEDLYFVTYYTGQYGSLSVEDVSEGSWREVYSGCVIGREFRPQRERAAVDAVSGVLVCSCRVEPASPLSISEAMNGRVRKELETAGTGCRAERVSEDK